MPNQWKLDLSEYGISDAATQELRFFCLRYPEMKRNLADLHNPLHAMAYDGMPHSANPGEPTASAAEKAAQVSQDCEMIEQAAIEADSGIYQWILKGVTEGVTYPQLRARGLPCSHPYFEKRRKKFFYLLAVKKKIL